MTSAGITTVSPVAQIAQIMPTDLDARFELLAGRANAARTIAGQLRSGGRPAGLIKAQRYDAEADGLLVQIREMQRAWGLRTLK